MSDAVINLFKGADSSDLHTLRPLLTVFLKGSQQKKRKLKVDHPEAWKYFSSVWEIRENHLVPNLSETYIFFLKCCLKPGCQHPLCRKKVEEPDLKVPRTWYAEGPPLSYLPLPVIDDSRPWGNTTCVECTGVCNGHYSKPTIPLALPMSPSPIPSLEIQHHFNLLKGSQPTSDQLDALYVKRLYYQERK